MSRAAILVHDAGTVRHANVHDVGVVANDGPTVPVRDLVDRDLIDACASLCDRLAADDFIAWQDQRQYALNDPHGWPALLSPPRRAHADDARPRGTHPLEIRHLGFTSTPTAVLRALQAVAGEDPFVVPSGPQRVTWLLGSAAGVGSVRALRRAGLTGSDGEPSWGIASRLAAMGLRAFACGVLPRHDETLGDAQAIDEWSSTDVRDLIDHRWGKTRRGPIRLARLLPPASTSPVNIAPPIERSNAVAHSRERDDEIGVDVVIPTLERPGPLADVISDLAAQDLVPGQVLVVEQRPDGSPSALGVLQERTWPFALEVETIRELGASQARNRALRRVRARWTALLDDDVRLAPGLLAAMVADAERWGADALSVGEIDAETKPIQGQSTGSPVIPDRQYPAPQTPDSQAYAPPRPVLGLGSGRSLVRRRALVAVGGFDEQIEGWGEDMELGLRMHHAGYTVLESRHLALVHLKAPRGGFRAPKPARTRGRIPPLPSPLIVYRWLRWMPPSMLEGTVRSHLVRAARNRWARVFALPWLWLRYRAAARTARARVAQGPRLQATGRESP